MELMWAKDQDFSMQICKLYQIQESQIKSSIVI